MKQGKKVMFTKEKQLDKLLSKYQASQDYDVKDMYEVKIVEFIKEQPAYMQDYFKDKCKGILSVSVFSPNI